MGKIKKKKKKRWFVVKLNYTKVMYEMYKRTENFYVTSFYKNVQISIGTFAMTSCIGESYTIYYVDVRTNFWTHFNYGYIYTFTHIIIIYR